MKKAILVLMALLLTAGFSLNAFAEMTRVSVSPRFTLNGSSASCGVTVTQHGSEIAITMELWQGNCMLESWEKSGTDSVILRKNTTFATGNTYTLTVYYSIDGVDYGPVETSSSN